MTQIIITASLIDIEDRPEVFYQHFGHHCIQIERQVYEWMRNLCESYTGGFWNFYQLSNGGFFMAPATNNPSLRLQCDGNFFEGDMSPEAAGIVACLFAFSMQEVNYEIYYKLRDYAADHPESDLIFAAID